jgi:hypothetical protein
MTDYKDKREYEVKQNFVKFRGKVHNFAGKPFHGTYFLL